MDVLEQLIKGQLKETDFPSLSNIPKEKPQEIIVFIVGGATYEEALHIAQLNASNNSVRVVLGGTTIHSSKRYATTYNLEVKFSQFNPNDSFLNEIAQLRNIASGYTGFQSNIDLA